MQCERRGNEFKRRSTNWTRTCVCTTVEFLPQVRRQTSNAFPQKRVLVANATPQKRLMCHMCESAGQNDKYKGSRFWLHFYTFKLGLRRFLAQFSSCGLGSGPFGGRNVRDGIFGVSFDLLDIGIGLFEILITDVVVFNGRWI